MRIEELELPPTTIIRLNTAPAGEPPSWQVLEDLSTGQKATAVLLLLLLESEAPLIVDQPEDDLDNRFITEGLIPRMREEKCRRQFIFSTHNANIPVLGDAELILGLTAAGGANGGKARIALEHMGSIDTQSVRELVEEILEGGKDAFETRRLKYGFRELPMNKAELIELIRNGESSGVEFKRDDIASEKLAGEVAALLNLEGGRILLGVEDDQTVTGLTWHPAKAEEWVMDTARTHLQPATIPYWETIGWDGDKVVGIVSLPRTRRISPTRRSAARYGSPRCGSGRQPATQRVKKRNVSINSPDNFVLA